MKWQIKTLARVFGLLSATTFVPTAAVAEDQAAPGAVDSAVTPGTRYGLFNGLDHRSWYNQGDFPEPFLVDGSGLEINEARLDWARTKAGDSHSDTAKAEIEKGFGLLTLEIEVPYERDSTPEGTVQGFANLALGARHPFYQLVSAQGFFDTTVGAAIEAGIPVNSAISKNAELVPKIFNDLRLGEHFTVQSMFGYAMRLGGGAAGGLRTFEYGFDFGYAIPHRELPIPGVQQFIPMFELIGETGLNQAEAGHTSLLGNACFRLNLKTSGRVQPRLGLGYIFPLNSGARADVRCGIVISLVFEY